MNAGDADNRNCGGSANAGRIWAARPRAKAGRLRGIRAGTAGPLVVLLHGVGLRAESWGAQIDAFEDRYTLLALDMAGHGHSPALSGGPAQLSDYTDLVAEAFDGPAIVVGHSMGAMIALDLAIRHPARVIGVAALNAIYRRTAEAAAAVRARADSLDGLTATDPTGTLRRWFGTAPSPAATACEDWIRSVDPAGYRAAYRVFATEDGPPDAGLAGLACPALFCTGAKEPNSTPAMSRQMGRLAPRGQTDIVTGAAHMMPMTHPAAVNDILAAFFATLTGSHS